MHRLRKARDLLSNPQVRRRPFRYAARRLRYELDRRAGPQALDRERVITFDDDLLIAVRPSEVVERPIYLQGMHEPLASHAFCALLSAGDVVVDAGAHIGQYSLLAARRVGSTGRVLAFEPNPPMRARLERNVALNHLSNVGSFGIALADKPGVGTLHLSADPSNAGMASLLADSGGSAGIQVECRTLDEVMEELAIPRLDVIKVDVEGAEAAVISGGRRSIERHHPTVMYEANDVDASGHFQADGATAMLRELGYDIFGIVAVGRGQTELRRLSGSDNPLEFREPWAALNLVALRR